jgi:hypothetical protein
VSVKFNQLIFKKAENYENSFFRNSFIIDFEECVRAKDKITRI